jgi:hypothetical protein
LKILLGTVRKNICLISVTKLAFSAMFYASSDRFAFVGKGKYNTSFRKDISEKMLLQSRNFSTPYYRQFRVIPSADGDGSPQLNSQR